MKVFVFLLIFLLSSSLVSAYIDPGTGGYLLSSIWASITGFFAIVFAAIVGFFRHTVKAFVKKHKILSILIGLVILLSLFAVFYYYFIFPKTLETKMQYLEYDENRAGVQIYDEKRAYDGYNLYHGKLMDMNGNVVRDWNYTYLSILDKDGFYYGQISEEGKTWGKFTYDDEPVWISDVIIHHEIIETPDDTIITFTKEPKEYNGRLVEFDVILEFDKNGTILREWSTWENLQALQQFHRKLELDNEPSAILPENHWKNTSVWGANYDYYHLNSLSIVPENIHEGVDGAFKPGNWIISFRHGSMTFIIDKDTGAVLWSVIFDHVEDNLEGQHVARMLQNGNILIFDNGRYREWSRIVEISPFEISKVLSEYKSDEFFTSSQGYFEIMPNGNLLISETEEGRVFEIDLNQDVVWEYYSDQKFYNEEDDVDIHYPIYRMSRYDRDFIEDLEREWG